MFERLSTSLSDLTRRLGGQSHISEKNVQDAVEEIKQALLDADVNLRVIRRFVNRALRDASGEEVLRSVQPGQQFIKVVYDRLVELLGGEAKTLELRGPDTVSVVLLLGLQGSGKTTSAGKLARHLQAKGRRVMLAATDLARAAAVEQLMTVGALAGVPVVGPSGDGDTPLSVAQRALSEARRGQANVLIVDTAGRTVVDDALMSELGSMAAELSPVASLLVADAMTGQSAVEVAQAFAERLDLTGVILSKMDSDARGGAALSIASVASVPVLFVGTGEGQEDLQPFYPDRMASRILGMGDVVTLVEKAQEAYSQDEALALQQKMAKAQLTIADYLQQIQRVQQMGSMRKLAELIPGMAGQLDQSDEEQQGMTREEAIILSMTPRERGNHLIIGPPRRRRIARGSGTSVHEVNQFLKKFEKMRQQMKKMAKNKKYQQQIMAQLGSH